MLRVIKFDLFYTEFIFYKENERFQCMECSCDTFRTVKGSTVECCSCDAVYQPLEDLGK